MPISLTQKIHLLLFMVIISCSHTAGCYRRNNLLIHGHATSNAFNKNLASIRGAITLNDLKKGNLKINGNVSIKGTSPSQGKYIGHQFLVGEESEQSVFAGILVIIGNLKSRYATYNNIEVNGTAELEHCTVVEKGEFFGNTFLTACNLNYLDLRGNHFVLKDSIVLGDILLKTPNGKGTLILDNTFVEGNAIFPENNIQMILKNRSRVYSLPAW